MTSCLASHFIISLRLSKKSNWNRMDESLVYSFSESTLLLRPVSVFVRSLWNSLGATLKCFGLIGFTVFVSYMGAIVLYVYNSGGIDHAIYAAVIVLIVNMIMYHVGFFNIR